jgi:prolyl-tRNA synthetase
MRLSRWFGTTLREPPAGVDAPGQQWLMRAGYLRQSGPGLFSMLPLGVRTLQHLEARVRQMMQALGGQELLMPSVRSAESWRAGSHHDQHGAEPVRARDRRDRDLVLATSHEDLATALCASEVRSYRQLPRLVYQIQTKIRDDARPRAGLARGRESRAKDAYSFDADAAGRDAQYQAHQQAYQAFFAACGLPVRIADAAGGLPDDDGAQAFVYLTPGGEELLACCPACGAAAMRQVARFARPPAAAEPALPLERIATPGSATIDALCATLGVPRARTAKVVMLMARFPAAAPDERFVMALVRGDMDVSEARLARVIGAVALRPATGDEIARSGAVPGYAAPIGLRDLLLVADETLAASPNLVVGANEAGYHLRNFNLPRDAQPTWVADIAAVADGYGCRACGAPLQLLRGIELATIARLAPPAGATFLDAAGQTRPVLMGAYGISIERVLACIAEEHHDARGLCWPIGVAPFQVHLIALAGKHPAVPAAAEQVLAELEAAGITVIYDDRDERAGARFADADMIGVPLRVTVSANTLAADAVELKRRDRPDPVLVPRAALAATLREQIDRLLAAAAGTLSTSR